MRYVTPQMALTDSDPRNNFGQCSASDVLRWSALGHLASPASNSVFFQMRRVNLGRALVLEGQPFENLYLVASGSFKCVQTDEDGYELVLAFAIHGDFIGLDGLGQSHNRSGAVALEDSSVVILPLHELTALGQHLPAMVTMLHHAAGTEVARRDDNQYLMAAPSSEVRVSRFLLQLARRQESVGHSGRRLRMVMTRRDIASYLGVAHETVSRVLMALARDGFIAVDNRDIELLDLGALKELQRLTRGRQTCDRRADVARHASPAPLNLAA